MIAERKEWPIAKDLRDMLSEENGKISLARSVPAMGSANAFLVWTYVCVTKGELFHFPEILAFLSSLILWKVAQKWKEGKPLPPDPPAGT